MDNSKLRVTLHSGRGENGEGKGWANHLEHPDKAKEPAWDKERTQGNLYWSIAQEGAIELTPGRKNLYKNEFEFYKKEFGEGLETRNRSYQEDGHREDVKTLEQFYSSKRYQPEEFVLQVGNSDQDRTDGIYNDDFKQRFVAASAEYLNWLNDTYGSNMKILSVAYHGDETSPHIHVRRVWLGEDKNGYSIPAQAQALRKLGFTLPEPEKKDSKKNNLKKVFDAVARTKLQDIYEEYGFEIERETKYSLSKHKTKEEYVLNKLIEREDHLEELKQRANEIARMNEQAYKEYSDTINNTVQAEKDSEIAQKKLEVLSAAVADAEKCQLEPYKMRQGREYYDNYQVVAKENAALKAENKVLREQVRPTQDNQETEKALRAREKALDIREMELNQNAEIQAKISNNIEYYMAAHEQEWSKLYEDTANSPMFIDETGKTCSFRDIYSKVCRSYKLPTKTWDIRQKEPIFDSQVEPESIPEYVQNELHNELDEYLSRYGYNDSDITKQMVLNVAIDVADTLQLTPGQRKTAYTKLVKRAGLLLTKSGDIKAINDFCDTKNNEYGLVQKKKPQKNKDKEIG